MLSVALQWKWYHFTYRHGNNLNKMVWFIVFNTTFNNISVISWCVRLFSVRRVLEDS